MDDIEHTAAPQHSILDMTRAGGTYAYQWLAFAQWCEESGRKSLPASPEGVADYLESRADARPSTLKVIAAAITRMHQESGHANPCVGVAQTTLTRLTQDEQPGPQRSLPLDLDAYIAIRETARHPRAGRGGRPEREKSAYQRGAFDIAVIGLMRDARLRVREATLLRWADLEKVEGGGRIVVRGTDGLGEPEYRFVSEDTMSILSETRGDAADDDLIIGLMPRQLGTRIGAAARQAGLGEGYSAESPRLGMLQDLETVGISLLGSHVSRSLRSGGRS